MKTAIDNDDLSRHINWCRAERDRLAAELADLERQQNCDAVDATGTFKKAEATMQRETIREHIRQLDRVIAACAS
jgi:hypothetical protein